MSPRSLASTLTSHGTGTARGRALTATAAVGRWRSGPRPELVSQRARRWRLVPGLTLVGALVLTGCGPNYQPMADARAEFARRDDTSVFIAVIADPIAPTFLDGVRFAVDRINAAGGLLNGRRLEVVVHPGSETFARARGTTRRIAADPRLTAVIGVRDSAVAVPASVVYQAAGLLFLPSFATSEALTRHGFDVVLRQLPNSAAMAAQTASVAALFGYRRIALLHALDDYSRELAFLFDEAARDQGIEIVSRSSFFGDQENYRGLLGQLNAIPFDALYLSSETAAGARILTQLRELGLHQPVLGSDRLNYGDLASAAPVAGERTIVPVVFSPDDPEPRKQAFVRAFTEAFGRRPDEAAAQGADAVGLLAFLIGQAGTTDPRVLGTTARYGQAWAGITGIYAFDPNGDLYGKSYRFQVMRFGHWWLLPGVTAPYLLSRFADYRRAQAEDAVASGSGMAPPVGTAVVAPPGEDVATTRNLPAPAPTPVGAAPAALAAADSTPAPASTPASVLAAGSASDPAPDVGATRPAVDPAAVGQGSAAAATVGAPVTAPVSAPVTAPVPAPVWGEADLDLAVLQQRDLSPLTRSRVWLNLAWQLLQFERLGIVVPPGETGRAAVSLARGLGERRGFRVTTCDLPVSNPAEVVAGDVDPDGAADRAPAGAPVDAIAGGLADAANGERTPLDQAALACYSRLAMAVDAMLVVIDGGLSPDWLRELNLTLRAYRIPAFALAPPDDADYGLTLVLAASGVDLRDTLVAGRFGGLLQDLRVNELSRKLANLPSLALDLGALATLRIRPDPRSLAVISRTLDNGDALSAPRPMPARDPAGPTAAPTADAPADPGASTDANPGAATDAATAPPLPTLTRSAP